jgi:glutathione S-transferase
VELIRDAKTAEHRRVQPFGQVPTYRDEEVDIFESGAIVLRIAERAGRLIPNAPGERLRAIQWLVAALNTVEPVVMEFAINEIFEADRSWSAERRPVVIGYIEERLTDLQARLGGQLWLDGDTFTVGDLMMVSVLGGLRGTGLLDRFPGLAAYVARGEARPAHRKAMADHLAVFERAATA